MSKTDQQNIAERLMHSMLYMVMSDIKRRKEKGSTFTIVLEDGAEIEIDNVQEIGNNNIFTDFMRLVNGKMRLVMRIRNDTYTRFKLKKETQ